MPIALYFYIVLTFNWLEISGDRNIKPGTRNEPVLEPNNT